MKLRGSMIGCAIGLFLVLSGVAGADTFTFGDDYANWPGYPLPPNAVIAADQIGTFPTVSGARVTTDSNGWLEMIEMFVDNRRLSDTLFINAMWDPGTSYEGWDYYVGVGQASTGYAVTGNPKDYIFVECPASAPNCHWRVGHPWQIDPANLTAAAVLSNISYDPVGNILTYQFAQNAIQLWDAQKPRFVIGYSQDCGNDVFLTPVPEPVSMLLLGFGLLGLAGMRRRFS